MLNTFALQWADQHRNDAQYATFDDFLAHYDSAAVVQSFVSYADSKHIAREDVKGEWVASWMNDLTRKAVADTSHSIHANSYEDYMEQLFSQQSYRESLLQKAQSEDRRRARINEHSDIYMGYLIKALIARNLFGSEYYYRVMKDEDEALKTALKTVKKL